jgi:hypothetical protein
VSELQTPSRGAAGCNDDFVTGGEQFICGFCGQVTTDDPRYVRIDLSWAHCEATQSLGAHHACLFDALRPGFPLAVEGPDE